MRVRRSAVRRGIPNATGIAICREGRKEETNWKENWGGLSHVGKKLLSVTFSRGGEFRRCRRWANSRLARALRGRLVTDSRRGHPREFPATFAKWIPMLLPLQIFDKREKQLDSLRRCTFSRHLYEISLASVCACASSRFAKREDGKDILCLSFFFLILYPFE